MLEGRVGFLRIDRQDGEGGITMGVVHNHGVAACAMRDIVNSLCGEAARCAAGPRQRLFVLAGDFNYADLGDARHQDGSYRRDGRPEQRGLRDFTNELLEAYQPSATCKGWDGLRRLDKFHGDGW